MIIRRITYAPFIQRFRQPLMTSRGSLTQREGILVALFDDDGHIGLGEVALLPLFGTETRAAALMELERLAKDATPCEITDELHELDFSGGKINLNIAKTPALGWALESAAATLLAEVHAQPLAAFISPDSPDSITVNALINGETVTELVGSGRRAIAEGFATLKVKVGNRNVAADSARMVALREAFPEIILRADANRAWTLTQASEFCHSCSDLGLQYLEDPLRENQVSDWEKLSGIGVPLALDEGGNDEIFRSHLLEKNLCRFYIIKPPLCGSWRTLISWARQVRAQGSDVIITSLFESSVGLSLLTHVAAALGSPQLAHGLGTAALLADDVLTPTLSPVQGYIHLPDLRSMRHQLPSIWGGPLEISI